MDKIRVFEEIIGAVCLRWWYIGEAKEYGLYMSDGPVAYQAAYSISQLLESKDIRELTPEEIAAIPDRLRPKERDWEKYVPHYRLEILIRRLNRLAKANKDEFRFEIKAEEVKPLGLLFRLAVAETTEGHEFISGMGKTLDEAVKDAEGAIAEAVEEWDWKEPS